MTGKPPNASGPILAGPSLFCASPVPSWPLLPSPPVQIPPSSVKAGVRDELRLRRHAFLQGHATRTHAARARTAPEALAEEGQSRLGRPLTAAKAAKRARRARISNNPEVATRAAKRARAPCTSDKAVRAMYDANV